MRVQVPSYNTHVDFPDGTPQEEIISVLKANFPEKPTLGSKIKEGVKEAFAPYVGLAEGAAQTATGLIAAPIAGIGGLAKTITSGPEAGTKTIEEISNALTYKPQTEQGKAAGELINKGMDVFVGAPSRQLGEYAEKVGGPVAGAATETAANIAIPLLFGGYAKGKAPVFERTIRKIDDIPSRVKFANDVAAEAKKTGKTLDQIVKEKLPEEAIPMNKSGLEGISAFESKGKYNAEHPVTGAYGKYQIMPSNLKAWAKEAMDAGIEIKGDIRLPVNQDIIANFKYDQYMRQFGDDQLAATAWFAGPKAAERLAAGDASVLSKVDANKVTVAEYIKRTTGREYGKETEVSKTVWDSISHLSVDEKLQWLSDEATKYPSGRAFAEALGEIKGDPTGNWKALSITSARDFWKQNHSLRRKVVFDEIKANDPDFFSEGTIEKVAKTADEDIIGLKEDLYEQGYSREEVARIVEETTKRLENETLGKSSENLRKDLSEVVDEAHSTAINEGKLFEDKSLFTLSGNQPASGKKFTPPERKGDRMFDTPKVTVDELRERQQPSLSSLEAQVKGGAISDLPKYAEGSSLNLDRLDTTNDVKQFINQRATDLSERIGKEKLTWAETRQKALELGMDWKDAVKSSKGITDLAAKVEATREIQMTMAEELFNKIKGLPSDPKAITPEMKMDIMNQISNHGDVLVATSKMSSEIGRALNIHKKMMASDPEFIQTSNLNRIMKEVMKKGNLEKVFDDIMTDLKGVDLADPAQVNKVIQKYHKASIADMIYEGWMNMLLSGPQTHIVNILSNALTAMTKPTLETPMAALLEMGKGKNKKAHIGEVRAELIGSWQGMKEGVRAAMKSYTTGVGSDLWAKAETPVLNAIPGKTGEVIRIPTRALSAADEFFKAIVYRSEINRMAYKKAANEGLKGEKRLSRMAELVDNPTPDMMEKAHNEALYRTFNKPLGKVGQQLMRLRDAIPFDIGRYIVPFLRTPTNIAKFALERTPPAYAKIIKDYRAGKIPKEELSAELAKPTVGTLMALVTYMLAKEGHITGGGPKDSEKKAALYRAGWQPYSFKIGDDYYGYNRLEPLGSVLGLAADLTEIAENKPFAKDDRKAGEIFGQLAMSMTKNLTSKTFMKGLSASMDAISDPQRYGESFIGSYAGSLIPSVVSNVARAEDPVLRQSKGALQSIGSRIPGVSEQLYPKRDIWGKEIMKPGNVVTRGLSPVPVSEGKTDKIDAEMVRLGIAPGEAAKKIRGVELTPDEYDIYSKLAGERARELVERFINSDRYDSTRDEMKKAIITNLIERARMGEGAKLWARMERSRAMKPMQKRYGIQVSE